VSHKLPSLGFLLLAVILAGCQPTIRYPIAGHGLITPIEDSPAVEPKLTNLARQDPGSLFEKALVRYNEQIKDYRCRLIRVERLNGKLTSQQQIDVFFLDKPFSVFLKWVKNPSKAEKLIYVQGQNKDKMAVIPVLLGWLTGPVFVDPQDPQARRDSRSPVTEFGFKQILQRIILPCQTGSLKDGSKFKDQYVGLVDVAGTTALALERQSLGLGPTDKNSPLGWRFCLDVHDLMPIAITEYGPGDIILGDYVFTNISYNVGLKPADFDLAALRR